MRNPTGDSLLLLRLLLKPCDRCADLQVKTNQKSLIKKILARYPTEFFSLKELVQNADDANASHVQICLTSSSTGDDALYCSMPTCSACSANMLTRASVWHSL